MPRAYRPPTTWLCVEKLLVIPGSIILPYVADAAFIALEMSLHQKSIWSWLFRHRQNRKIVSE